MVARNASSEIIKLLTFFPAVVILGSRQCGKSTLVKMLQNQFSNYLYIDLQDRRDRMKLTNPILFFQNNENRTVCLDEIQLMPDLFEYLRSEIDRNRHPGRFILLGSASRDLLQHTTESLAGRIGLIDLSPFTISELSRNKDFTLNRYWFRGGYPESYLAPNDEFSSLWRENYIRTYLERDIPQLGFSIAAPQMMRMLTMLAHEHGGILNCAKLASAMDLSAPTIRHYIDILEQTYLVRTLPPYFTNTKKRLVKSPRLYLRDSGLLHQILGLRDMNDLLGHPILGLSWEGMVIENVCTSAKRAKSSFYRSANGSEEMDLVLEYPDRLIAIECKSSTEPQPTAGFWKAVESLRPARTYIVAPIEDSYPLTENVEVTSLDNLCQTLLQETDHE